MITLEKEKEKNINKRKIISIEENNLLYSEILLQSNNNKLALMM